MTKNNITNNKQLKLGRGYLPLSSYFTKVKSFLFGGFQLKEGKIYSLTNKDKLLILITAIGAFLRFYDLGAQGLWVDESLFAFWVREGNYIQETVPIFIGHIFGFRSEFWLRSISAFFGTLTIPAIYIVVKERKLSAALIVAIFPLFVFWSRMARPYALAGFFVVLGWRFWWAYIPALLTTPISLVGIRLVNWKFTKRTLLQYRF